MGSFCVDGRIVGPGGAAELAGHEPIAGVIVLGEVTEFQKDAVHISTHLQMTSRILRAMRVDSSKT